VNLIETGVMKQQTAIQVWALALLLGTTGPALADGFPTSVQLEPLSPSPLCPGSTAASVVTINKSGGGSSDFVLSVAGLSKNISVSFSPNPVHISGSATAATATMNVSTTGGTLPGPHPFQVIATAGSSHNSVSNTAVLNMTLCSPAIAPMSDGGMAFAFTSVPGQNYQIQASANFLAPDWVPLCTTNATTNLLIFVDRDAQHLPSRFYRAVPQ
jgi:hypothetical protein